MQQITSKISKTITGLFLVLLSTTAVAAPTSSPYAWDKFLKTITDNLQSSVVLFLGIIAIVICGLIMAFTDLQGGGKKAVQVGIGISVATSASSILSSVFSKGALIF